MVVLVQAAQTGVSLQSMCLSCMLYWLILSIMSFESFPSKEGFILHQTADVSTPIWRNKIKHNFCYGIASQWKWQHGSVQQDSGRAACSHLPTPWRAGVGPRKNASPLGSRVVQVEIRTLEHSGNNRLQEALYFGVASGITSLAQIGTYPIPGDQATKTRL